MTIINEKSLIKLNPNKTRFVDARNIFMNEEATKELISKSPFMNSTHVPEKPYMVAAENDGYNNGRSPMPYGNVIKSLYKDLMTDVQMIVIFSFDNSFHHTRLYYLFKLYGLDSNLYIGKKDSLKAFLQNVTTEKIELSTEFNKYEIEMNKDIYMTMDEVQVAINDPNHLLIDVRAHDRYIGGGDRLDPKSGHIPTAVNIPNTKLYVDGNLSLNSLPEELELIKRFTSVTVSCGSGMSATPMFVFLDYHKVPVKLFGGSFSEWITDDSNTVETKINTLESRVDCIE
ncbi:sulfurtransferase [Phocicoccus pinnipedialis]|uniref:Rhodanese domain-containing protein n=1 Tax=Phocicoccus pinnipedialis TaxID=110845 RepID=A0A6V7REW3_9BACL|nr:rhodanese-like domain-containing protein [Jeotgalicoccus pinnipedialis]MBP1939394.1 thiosulfate/3-mercaptopyruvate sulfurtransferase [Jeotgalicoccus pinnipedialis]CAD2075539.1 hypothetical protein JEOPIN946_01046 [Jeotgalicoccus pinnipedialis]